MNAEAEWESLIRVWLNDDARADDTQGIRRRVLADSRRMSLTMLLEYVVAAVLVCVAAWKLTSNDGLDTFVWGFAVLWFTGMALQFSATNRQGLWRPAGESTRAYIDLALERVRRRERALRFAWLLYGLELAFLVAWYPATWFLWPLETWPLIENTPRMLGMLGVITLALVAWSISVHGRNRAERSEFERLQREIAVPT